MSALADAARGYIGVRFRHRGRNRLGLDCVGLAVAAYADCGISLPDFRLYGREPHRDGLVARVSEALGEPVSVAPVTRACLMDGDVIVVRYEVQPHHVAVLGEKDYGGIKALTLIHSEGVHGEVLEQRLTDDVISRITHVYRKPV